MINGKSVCAVIPARAGSQRLPNKNLMLLWEHTLIGHAVMSARGCPYIDDVVISTDISPDAIDAVTHNNAVIYKRPSHLCGGDVDIAEVIKDVAEHRAMHDYFVTLQPATPLRTGKLLTKILRGMIDHNCDSALTVTECVPWLWKLNGEQATNSWHPNPYPRSQDGVELNAQEINCAQITSRENVLAGKRWGLPLLLAILPKFATLDIDTHDDYEEARMLILSMRQALDSSHIRFNKVTTINGLPQ